MHVDTVLPVGASVDCRQAAAAAESAGYAAAWTGEVKHDPFLAVGLAAVATESIELGTGIAVAFARSPMSMAVQANDLQLLSGGRLLLGLGSQIRAHITRRFSMPWSHPAPRMREYIMAMRAIWDCWNDGARLNFRGDYYTHTLMTPFFDPGPNLHGAPRVLLAGVGDVMTAVAGEVADGFLCHAFTTERYLREITRPALERGRAGRGLAGYQVSGSPFVATGRTEEELAQACRGVRGQIAFYGSTPAYRPVLELHGWGELAEELHRLSLQGQWKQMGEAIDETVLNTFAVVAEPAAVAAELVRRYGDVMTRMTLYTPYALGPDVLAQIVGDLRRAAPEGEDA
ncbi:MAG TPA: TIGR03617 family F420-dependent LLM class oxidoreductase [Streptosporangiaceae bacterium]|nr:TIGR03617 family F420-dependent LLM class oxidoreductase [Streptosporangiaceae bacterium]